MPDSRFLVMPALLLGLCANSPEPVVADQPDIMPSSDMVMLEVIEPAEAMLAPEETRNVTVPAKTPISLEILADLGSKTSKTGDRFALQLAEPVVVDGVEVIPAGTQGHGEVVHAKKNGSFGVPGELVIAARELAFQGRTIRLRSLRIAEAGKGRTEGVGIAVAAAGTPAMLVGAFIKGDQVMIANGTLAEAMIAEEFVPETEAGATPNQQPVAP